MSDEGTDRPALGSELAAGVGVMDWPRAWPLPECHGPLAPFDLRTHILGDVERRLFPVLAAAANGQGPDAERSTAEVRTLAAVLRSLTPKAAESLASAAVTGKGWPSSGAIREQLDDARHRELERSMPTRWRLANGPPLTVDELGPLLSPRNRLADLAEWLTNSGPRHDEDARAAIRVHVEALEPAEIAVERLEIPVDRARQTREQILTLLDSGSAAADVGRMVTAYSRAWESLRPRLMALKPGRRESRDQVDRATTAGDTNFPVGPGSSLTFDTRIGQGGFGEVWRGFDRIRPLAIKLFHGESAQATKLAVEHAAALAKVDHPNIVRVYFVDWAVHPITGERMPCAACELVEGETLGEWLHVRAEAQQPIDLADARRIGLAIIDGVVHIHARDTVHGDLHSGNVMVAGEVVKVIDLYSSGSLRVVSTAPREMRARIDVSELAWLCHELLLASNASEAAAAAFAIAALGRKCTLDDVRTAFEDATSGEDPSQTANGVEVAEGVSREDVADEEGPSTDALEVLHALTRDAGSMRGQFRTKTLSDSFGSYVLWLGGDTIAIQNDPRRMARLLDAIRDLESWDLLVVDAIEQDVPSRGKVTGAGWTRSDSIPAPSTYWWKLPSS